MFSMEVVFLPHPPIALPDIGDGKERAIQKTLDGYKAIAHKVAKIKPKTIVVISPHGHSFSNGINLLAVPSVEGDLSAFGFGDITMSKKINLRLTHMIELEWETLDLLSVLMDEPTAKSYGIDTKIDHGALVPLYFIDQLYETYDLVHMTPSGQSVLDHYRLGIGLKEAIKQWDEPVLVLCSGDLSHALKSEGPYEAHPFGKEFDRLVVKAIKEKEPELLMDLSAQQINNAAQCGLKSFMMGFGVMDGYDYDSEVLSYEGPFGVGYLTGFLANDFTTVKPSKLELFEKDKKDQFNERIKSEDDYVKVARLTIEHYVKSGKKPNQEAIKACVTRETMEELQSQKAGAFVSIHKDGILRGCMGTIEGVCDSLLDEIIYNAITACSSDPRFHPVEVDEIMLLEIKVDRLYEPEIITDLNLLDVYQYGVIVEQGHKKGLLLPNLEGITTVEEQLQIAKDKAGIHDSEGLTYYRFEVERHG